MDAETTTAAPGQTSDGRTRIVLNDNGAFREARDTEETVPGPVPGLGLAGYDPPPDYPASRSAPLRRRKRIILAMAGVAIVSAGGGVLASSEIKSPAQVAAQTAPPALTVLTAPVTRQVVSETVLAQGVVSQPPEISGPASFTSGGSDVPVTGGAAAGGAVLPIVTRIFLGAGSAVHAGSVLAEVAGRPLFVFEGTVPAYRDLAPGESGADVAQLQQGLESAGYSIGDDTPGSYGPGTAAAVAAYYQSIGYRPVTTQGTAKKPAEALVPSDEIMFVPRLPAHVVSYAASVGQMASASLVTLSMGNPLISGQIDPADQGLVRSGTGVSISPEGGGRQTTGTVVSVSGTTQTQNSITGGSYLPARITPMSPLPVSMIGQDVQLTIVAAHSDGPVLAVPEAAVFASANGQTYVNEVRASQTQIRVPVTVGVTGDGLVEVTPAGGARLTAGDKVVTGEDYARGGNAAGGGRA
jgi:membrane fusion protein, multidrug efflux system